MNNNRALLVVMVLIVLAGGVTGYYFLSSKKPPTTAIPTEQTEEEVVPTIKPDEIGLKLVSRSDKKAVKFVIENVSGITNIEYELTYLASGDIPRGIIGNVEVSAKDKTIESKYIDLGSCSSGRCKYDEGVTSVKFVFKITKEDGKVYQVEESLDF